jgi:hypothetical protein
LENEEPPPAREPLLNEVRILKPIASECLVDVVDTYQDYALENEKKDTKDCYYDEEYKSIHSGSLG